MFEIGSIVWVEYDGSEAYIGTLLDVTEDEFTLRQLAERKILYGMRDELREAALNVVLKMRMRDVRTQLSGILGLGALPYLILGSGATRIRLAEELAQAQAIEGLDMMQMLKAPVTVILPRMGSVVYDGQVKIDQFATEPDAVEEEGEESVEAVEEDIDAEVAEFAKSVEAYKLGEEETKEF